MARPAVFLDRDGVLNAVVERDGQPGSPRRLDEFRLVEDAVDAVSRLRSAGLPVCVVTNQPDLTRGLLPAEAFAAMNALLTGHVGVDEVVVCPHDDADGCGCRKPLPGMLERLAAERDLELARSYMVGDTWRDVGAGRAAGCRTVLIRSWYNTDTDADVVVDTLGAAADWILEREQSEVRSRRGGSADDAR